MRNIFMEIDGAGSFSVDDIEIEKLLGEGLLDR
jgi:hypothetical protein